MMSQRIVAKEGKSALRLPLVNGVNVTKLVEVFEDLGFECEVGGELTGMSGISHPFDIIARNDAEVLVLDLMVFRSTILDTPASDHEVSQQLWKTAVTMRIKSWDSKPTQSMILHLSSYLHNEDQGLSEHDPLRGFLNQFEIKLIRSADMQHAADKLRTFLAEVETA